MKIIFAAAILIIILVSGCIGQVANEDNNVVFLIISRIVPVEVKIGKIVDAEFTLQNKGDNKVNAKLSLVDLDGFQPRGMGCEGQKLSDTSCEMEIGSWDTKRVSMSLAAPNSEQTTKLEFLVEYPYSGTSIMSFNVWDSDIGIENQKGSKKLKHSTGPVRVNMDVEIKMEVIVNNNRMTINDWVIEGSRFDLTLKPINLKGFSSGYSYPNITIPRESFKISLSNVHVDEQSCELEKYGNYYIPEKNVKISDDEIIRCKLVADEIQSEWKTATIQAEYSYVYKFIKEQEIKVV